MEADSHMRGHGPAIEGTAAKEAHVLEQRAQALAKAVDDPQGDELVSMVTFWVGGRKYGIEAYYVREVLQQAEVSLVPWAPPGLLGVTNIRGEVLAVADLGRLLGTTPPTTPAPVIVLDSSNLPLGILVEQVEDFVTLPSEAVGQLPVDTGGPARSLLLGVSAEAVVLDARALLDEPRFSSTQQE